MGRPFLGKRSKQAKREKPFTFLHVILFYLLVITCFGASESHMKEMKRFCMSGFFLHRTSCAFAGVVSNIAIPLAERAIPKFPLMQRHHLPHRVWKMHHNPCMSPQKPRYGAGKTFQYEMVKIRAGEANWASIKVGGFFLTLHISCYRHHLSVARGSHFNKKLAKVYRRHKERSACVCMFSPELLLTNWVDKVHFFLGGTQLSLPLLLQKENIKLV